MSITLSSSDVAGLEAAQQILLAPLEHPMDDWLAQLGGALRRLIGAESSTLLLAGQDGRLLQSELSEADVKSYFAYYHACDIGFDRVNRKRLEVAHYLELASREEWDRSEMYNDWFLPTGLRDAMGVQFARGGEAAWILLHSTRQRDERWAERSALVLRCALPSVKAGVYTWLRVRTRGGELGRLIDALGVGMLLFGTGGVTLHRNPALERLLEGDPERSTLEAGMREAARAFAAPPGGRAAPVADTRVQTARGAYRMQATSVREALPGTGAVGLLVVEPGFPVPVPDSELRERYGLTRQEVRVARLLAAGRSNAQIARELVVTTHTARRHTEHVLHKLGVASRAQVGPKLQHGLG